MLSSCEIFDQLFSNITQFSRNIDMVYASKGTLQPYNPFVCLYCRVSSADFSFTLLTIYSYLPGSKSISSAFFLFNFRLCLNGLTSAVVRSLLLTT